MKVARREDRKQGEKRGNQRKKKRAKSSKIRSERSDLVMRVSKSAPRTLVVDGTPKLL